MALKDPQPIVHNQSRTFASYPGTKYVLPVDELEKERLASQHFMIKRAFDNKLVLAPVSLSPGDEILDSATGTGIWLLDIAPTLPSSISLHGLDIESLNFPPPSSYPPNIHLSTGSILSLPLDWTSKFSFIHQRLVFTPAIPVADTPTALSEMHRVLKPGGWVQLLEVGNWTAGLINEKHKDLVRKFTSSRGIDWHCYKSLPSLLSQAQFTNVTTVKRTLPLGKGSDEGVIGKDNLLGVFKGMKIQVLNGGGFGVVNSEEEFDTLLEELEREWDETEEAMFEWVVMYGQKSVD